MSTTNVLSAVSGQKQAPSEAKALRQSALYPMNMKNAIEPRRVVQKGTRSTHNTDAFKGRNGQAMQSCGPQVGQQQADAMSAHNNNQRGYVRDDLHSTANKNLQSQLKARRELAPIQNPKKQAQSLIQKKLKAKDLG